MLRQGSMHNDQRFRALIEHSSDAFALLTQEGTITYASLSSERITGYPAEVLVGMNAFALLHPDDLENVGQQFTMLLDRPGHSITIEYRIGHKNGTWRWMEGTATNLLHDPAIQAIVVNFRDTTDRKQLEHQLRFSELKLRSLVESNILGVAVSDGAGRIHEVNDRFVQMFGCSKEELLSGAVTKHQLIPEDYREALAQHEEILLATGAMPPWEKECLRKDGSRVPTLMAGALLDREQGLALVLFHDISDRKEVERRKQEFLITVSHELRTPITTITGLAEILQQLSASGQTLDSPRSLRAITLIAEQSQRLTRLIEEMLDLSRIENAQLKVHLAPHDLVQTLVQVIESQALTTRRHGLRLVLDGLQASDGLIVSFDEQRMVQVLSNLISNAIKYSPAGGEIEIGVQRDLEQPDECLIWVKDQGIGIPTDALAHIFERFYRSGNLDHTMGGLGIGLYLVNEIVTRHGGQVHVESMEGRGSTFYVRLPLDNRLKNDGSDA